MRLIVLVFSLGLCGAFATNGLAETRPQTADSLMLDLSTDVRGKASLIAEDSFMEFHEEPLVRKEVLDRFDADSEAVIVAPEPSSLIAFMFGLSALMMRWDRRRSQAEVTRSRHG